jgi:hypothetical protein
LEGYTNTNMAGDFDDRKRTLRFLFTINVGRTIPWQSILPKYVSLSTIEAEYIVMTEIGKTMF